jgi:hypothetical protein
MGIKEWLGHEPESKVNKPVITTKPREHVVSISREELYKAMLDYLIKQGVTVPAGSIYGYWNNYADSFVIKITEPS